jgi:hypothetical protein
VNRKAIAYDECGRLGVNPAWDRFAIDGGMARELSISIARLTIMRFIVFLPGSLFASALCFELLSFLELCGDEL